MNLVVEINDLQRDVVSVRFHSDIQGREHSMVFKSPLALVGTRALLNIGR